TDTAACGPTPTVSFTDNIQPGFIARAWKAVDCAGNMTTCTQVLTIVLTTSQLTVSNTAANVFNLCAHPTNNGPFSYVWTKDGVVIPGAGDQCLVVSNAPGLYCVRVTGTCNSVTNCTTISGAATVVITTTANPAGAGTTSGGGTVPTGQSVTVM